MDVGCLNILLPGKWTISDASAENGIATPKRRDLYLYNRADMQEMAFVVPVADTQA